MAKRKIGFTIACYDKFREVAVLTDLIKHNYPDFESVIYVGSNHPDAAEQFVGMPEIDRLCKGDDLTISKGRHSSEARFDLSFNERVCSIVRTLSNTQVAVNQMLKDEDVEYIITLHSDSWFLNPDKLSVLMDLMAERGTPIGVHGMDTSHSGVFKEWRLYVIDFFHVMEANFLREHNIFDFSPFDMLAGAVTDAHSTIFLQLMAKAGLHNVVCYSDAENMVFWDGQPVYSNRFLAPYCYDPLFDLVHVNVGSFHDNLGQALQAMHLQKSNMKGDRISAFIEEFGMPEEQLMGRLADYEREYARKLRWRLTSFEKLSFSKSFRYIERYLQQHSWWEMVAGEVMTWPWRVRCAIGRAVRGASKTCGVANLVEQYAELDGPEFDKYTLWHKTIHLTDDERAKIESPVSQQAS